LKFSLKKKNDVCRRRRFIYSNATRREWIIVDVSFKFSPHFLFLLLLPTKINSFPDMNNKITNLFFSFHPSLKRKTKIQKGVCVCLMCYLLPPLHLHTVARPRFFFFILKSFWPRFRWWMMRGLFWLFLFSFLSSLCVCVCVCGSLSCILEWR
jgi:hypothetical protein